MDEWHLNAETSFHRGLFAFEPGPVSEFMEPRGRMRSRVLRPPAGDVRVVLSVADTQDVGARAESTRSRSAATTSGRRCAGSGRSVPTCSTCRRTTTPTWRHGSRCRPRWSADLREHGLLYDRDGDGELLHTYTPLVDGRFYVELLERRGGYDGFGSANTAVRLALQATPTRTCRRAAGPALPKCATS